MGLFKFLSKKASIDELSQHQATTKGQAYDSTTIAPPPIRGTLPVRGNGPTNIQNLKQAARHRAQAHNEAGLDTTIRLRSRSVGRPNTAPDAPASPSSQHRPKSSGKSGARKRDPTRAQPFLVNKRPGPPYLIGLTGPQGDSGHVQDDNASTKGRGQLPPPVPPISSHFKQSSISTATWTVASDTASIKTGMASTSNSVTKPPNGYIDILDAQGALKPSDFKTRVKAAGARDYGEDVAERNLGVNGVDLTSPAVQAFYALTGGAQLAYKSDGSAIDVFGNKYAAGSIPIHFQRAPRLVTDEQYDSEPALSYPHHKAKSKGDSYPKRTTSLEPRFASLLRKPGESLSPRDATSAASEAAMRRKSVHGSALSPPSYSQPMARPLSMHSAMMPDYHIDAATIPDIPRSRPNTGSSAGQTPTKLQNGRSRDSSALSKEHYFVKTSNSSRFQGDDESFDSSTIYDGEETETDEAGPYQHQRPQSPQRKGRDDQREPSYDEIGIVTSDDFLSPVPPAPPARNPNRNSGLWVDHVRQLQQQHQEQQNHQVESDVHSQPGQKAISLIGQIHSEQSQPSTSRPSSSSSRTRNRSVGASSSHAGRVCLDDITEHIPNRSSSLSVSSVTPTVASSNQSSNPFPRPPSRHTANTSIDLAYSIPVKPPAIDYHALNGKNSRNTFGSIRGSRENVASTSPVYDNEDGYLTSTTDGSDIESYIKKRTRKNRDGEGLLFNESGYGGALPGLFDSPTGIFSSLPAPSSLPSTQYRPKSSGLRHSRAPISRPFTGHSRVLPNTFPTWDEGDSSSSMTVSEPDIETPRGDNGASHAASHADEADNEHSLNGIGHLDDKLSTDLAVRLRKQLKRRNRIVAREKLLQEQKEGLGHAQCQFKSVVE
ncbi:unnamed protein product [Clonostachys rosea f. rosea IK726]|uniref:Uncharacterized protein n=1 Tax=Clonostachys rosea f. rosea IK726 TaxID=1349383 RepID=A0ACA9TG89_BIOOC|nr:unnamed protein product [Clonostachys rosea f. rosea IK726]